MAAYMKRDDVIVLLVANLAGPMSMLHGASNVEDQVIERAISYADKLQAQGVIGEQSLTDAFAELRSRVSESLPKDNLSLNDDGDDFDDDGGDYFDGDEADDDDLDLGHSEPQPNPEGGRDFRIAAETGVFDSKSGDTEPASALSVASEPDLQMGATGPAAIEQP